MTPTGMRQSFHFGIDVSAPDGAPVYATISGTVQRSGHRPEVVGVGADDGHVSFEYWHIRPVVSAGERVTAYRTIVGYIEEGWGHVHFSELRDDVYLNPLRPGAIGPYEDRTQPVVKSLRVERGAHGVKKDRLKGTLDLVVEAIETRRRSPSGRPGAAGRSRPRRSAGACADGPGRPPSTFGAGFRPMTGTTRSMRSGRGKTSPGATAAIGSTSLTTGIRRNLRTARTESTWKLRTPGAIRHSRASTCASAMESVTAEAREPLGAAGVALDWPARTGRARSGRRRRRSP